MAAVAALRDSYEVPSRGWAAEKGDEEDKEDEEDEENEGQEEEGRVVEEVQQREAVEHGGGAWVVG
jgi:hypothetical protein